MTGDVRPVLVGLLATEPAPECEEPPECTCAMSEATFRTCEAHGEDSFCPDCGEPWADHPKPAPTTPPDVRIRRNGSERYPWQAICRRHRDEQVYVAHDVGAVAFNSRGVGNRTWALALLAANRHLEEHHA